MIFFVIKDHLYYVLQYEMLIMVESVRLYRHYINPYPIIRFNPVTFVCLSKARTWISNAICNVVFFFVFSELWLEEIVRFVDIGGLISHRCLNCHNIFNQDQPLKLQLGFVVGWTKIICVDSKKRYFETLRRSSINVEKRNIFVCYTYISEMNSTLYYSALVVGKA